MANKGHQSKDETFAKGGASLGRTRDFLKESDGADQRYGGVEASKDPDTKEEDYSKKGKSVGSTPAKGKSLKPVKPRS